MFRIQDLKTFRTDKEQAILENICLTSDSKECISITGYNGSGKSTLAFALIGLIPFHYQGKVTGSFFINNDDIFNLAFAERLNHISYVFQDTESQILFGTVADILGLNERNTDKVTVNDLIDIFNIRHLLNKKPNELSSGEAQKLALISATRNNPQLIIYDEATSALDPKIKKDFGKVVDYLLKREKNIILLGQNETILKSYSTKTFYLYNKTIHTKINLYEQDNSNDFEHLFASFKTERIINKIDFKHIEHLYKNWNFSLSVNNLLITHGETVAIVGENGSGKSTFLNVIIGFIKAKKIKLNIPVNQLKDNMYIAFASPSIQLCEATVKDELIRVNKTIVDKIDTIQKLFPFLQPDKDPFELSFGQQRLLTFLQAILSNKQILIFDEPELGIDDKNMQMIKALLQHNLIAKDRIILYVTHNLELAGRYSSRVIKFHNGQIERDELNSNLCLTQWFDL